MQMRVMKTIRVALILSLLCLPVFAGSTLDLSSPSNYNIRLDGARDGDYLGSAVAVGDINNDGFLDLVVGSNSADNNELQSGSVYIIFGGASLSGNIDLNSSLNYTARFDGAAAGDQLGSSVACGDIDGDGLDDIIMGTHLADNNGANSGSVYVVFGSASLSGTKSLSVEANFTVRFDGAVADNNLGYSLGVGDVDNDGRDDLVLGAHLAGSGEAYLIFGKTSFTRVMTLSASENYDAKFIGEASGDRFGSTVALGDADGDDYDDILIGAFLADFNDRDDSGSVYLINGSTSYSPQNRSMTDPSYYTARFDGAESSDELGNPGAELGNPTKSLAVGDVNGGGNPDLIIGAHKAQSGAGSVYLISGEATLADTIDLDSSSSYYARFDGASAGDRLGTSVALGNINNDGSQDMLLGAAWADQNFRDKSGSVYLIYGTSEAYATKVMTLSASANYDLRFDGAAAGDKLGYSLAGGDINGDGKDDSIMGARSADNNAGIDSGSVYVYAAVAQPFVSSISPSNAKNGWIGDITLTGANFESGASASFDDSDFLVYSTIFDSATSLRLRVAINSDASPGARNLTITITNPGGVSGEAVKEFTVDAAGTGPGFSSIFFTHDGNTYTDVDADGNLLLPAHTGLSISGKIVDTANNLPSSEKAIKFSVISGNMIYYNLSSQISDLAPTSAVFSTNFNISSGTSPIILYAENSNGDPTQYPIPFKVTDTSKAIEEIFIGKRGDKLVVQIYVNRDTVGNHVLVGSNPHPIVIKNVKLYSPKSIKALGVGSSAAIERGFNTVEYSLADLGLPNGIYMYMVIQNGKPIGTQKFWIY